ncbi:hypothetical protein WCLP8_5420007 [uncultured Gammaproteobacteria bacterium]
MTPASWLMCLALIRSISQVEDRVRAAGSDQLDEWSDLILDARELADVFATDQKH